MIEIYRGGIIARADETCLFKIDSLTLSKKFTSLMNGSSLKQNDFSLLEKKYYFKINNSLLSDYPFMKFIVELEKAFPQLIWTKIIKSEIGYFKVEFIPIPLGFKREGEDGNLVVCLQNMGYHSKTLITSFQNKFEEILKLFDEDSIIKKASTLIYFGGDINKRSNLNLYRETDEDLLLRLNKLQFQFQMRINLEKVNEFEENVEVNCETNTQNKVFENKSQGTKPLKIGIGVGIILLFIIVFELSHFYSLAKIDGNSMNPTLANNTIIFIEKQQKHLKHNDIIIFTVPQLANKKFVKRIIGLPGDKVYAAQGNIYINGKKVENQYDSQNTTDFTLKEISARDTVPRNKIFVLGDNREHSTDSRTFGFVDSERIEGKVISK